MRSAAFCRTASCGRSRIPDFDFSQFRFEWTESLYGTQQPVSPIGDIICFKVFYQDIQLDYGQYAVRVELCGDGRYELNACFLTKDLMEKLAEIDTTDLIAKETAIDTAKAYAAEMKLATETCKYQPSERLGEDTVLVYYDVENGCLAYMVPDPVANHYSTAATYYRMRANVFVDAKTGKVLENRYDQMVAVT